MDQTKHLYVILSTDQERTDEVFVYVKNSEEARTLAMGDTKTFIGKGSGIIEGTPTIKDAVFK